MISNSNFLLTEIPQFHPLSMERLEWWKTEKRKCIEGIWFGGKYMPGLNYFNANFWTIQLNKDGAKVKSLGRPTLRDIEWEKGYIFLEARGFSGFELDTIYTCDRLYKPEVRLSNEGLGLIPKNNLVYTEAREYLRKIHSKSLGKPLFRNDAKNVMEIGSRGYGKSYWTSCMIAYNFLFDGCYDYDDYFKQLTLGLPFSSETLVGAIDAKYSKDLLNKVQLGLDELPGSIEYNGDFYPSPLSKSYQGSLMAGKYIEALREVKIGDNWKKKGSRSKIHHRSFGDNPFAGNGTRPGLTALEEIGFMGNLLPALGALKECTRDGGTKFGTIWMLGTGGDMEGGATQAAQTVFYDPESYDCLVFDDEWENKGKIGLFYPAYMGLNEFKDKEGNTNKEAAKEFLLQERAKLERGRSKRPLNDELQNRPIKPSEAFLVTLGNIFPIADLKHRLSELESNEIFKDVDYIGTLNFNDDGKVEWKPNPRIKPIFNFPILKDENQEGGILIHEMPYEDELGNIPFGRYIAGCDPYDQDKSETGSLGSTIIYDRLTKRIVAEYSGRPRTANEYYEQVRRLLIYFNARLLYENERKGIFQYFEQKNCTYLLIDQPEYIHDIVKDSRVDRGKGMHMSTPLKEWGEELIKMWLLELNEDVEKPDLMNLNKMRTIPLLKELIAYNDDGNFDRVMALMMVMYHLAEIKKLRVKEQQENYNTIAQSEFFNRFDRATKKSYRTN
jgi:hypothetical protein